MLANDYQTVVYKENRDDWRCAEIVITTVQSLLYNNKFQRLFSPTDFDLIISDEAHRSISGNARAVFEYFIGYKLGLTATPRDYLKHFDKDAPGRKDPRENERRLLLDTYRTFGCAESQPTFRYSLIDGVNEGFLINPTVVDARTEITTELLSESGYVVEFTDENGEDKEEAYKQRQFEKRFFSDATNQVFCKTFLENALLDPISGEIGKSIIFAVSQHHAGKLTQILNVMADKIYPGKLMTTGYDCPDLLNLGLFRPIFSPTDFIQIKGRGTRKHDFSEDLHDLNLKAGITGAGKIAFKLFDFFANCEYFEEQFDYDEVIELPKIPKPTHTDGDGDKRPDPIGKYEYTGSDIIDKMKVVEIGAEGMKIDRMFFNKFEDTVKENDFIATSVETGQWNRAIDYVNKEIFDKPKEYYTLDKLRRAAAVDRRLTLREILEKIFGLIPRFKLKDELLEEEFSKFVADYKPDEAKSLPAIKHYFKAYVSNNKVRDIIESKEFTRLATNAVFSTRDFRAVPLEYRQLIPEYIKDYVPLNQFVA